MHNIKGIFLATSKGLENKSFVSIEDVLHVSINSGLEFFYSRLIQRRGFLFMISITRNIVEALKQLESFTVGKNRLLLYTG